MKSKLQFEKLIRKLIRNEADDREIRDIFHSIRTDQNLSGSNLPEVESTRGENDEYGGDYDSVWARVERQISAEPQRKRIWQLSAFRVAAAILVLVVAGLAAGKIYQYYSWTEYTTSVGEIRTIELEDGSSVVLNGNSGLRVPGNLSTDHPRDVYLTGEANFQVAKAQTQDARFVVHTRDLDVEVLGTRFNVNSRDEETVVYLEEGSVKVRREDKNGQEIYLSPGEKLGFSLSDQTLKLIEVESEVNEISWREGIFEFENQTLDKILKQITDPYDYEYQIESEGLKDRTFTVRIPDNDLKFSISLLEKITGTSISDNKGTLIISIKDEDPNE